MRWDELLDQLEGQWLELTRDRSDQEIADYREAEAATLLASSRLLGSMDRQIRIQLLNGVTVSGIVIDVGADWCLIQERGRQYLVPFHGIATLQGLTAGGGELGVLAKKLKANYIVREFSRRSIPVHIVLMSGTATGPLLAAHADHLDVMAQQGKLTVFWQACLALASGPGPGPSY